MIRRLGSPGGWIYALAHQGESAMLIKFGVRLMTSGDSG